MSFRPTRVAEREPTHTPTPAIKSLIGFADILDDENGITTIVRDGVTYRYRPAAEPTNDRPIESVSSSISVTSSTSNDVVESSSRSSSSSSDSSTTSRSSVSSVESSSSSVQVRFTASRLNVASSLSSVDHETLAHKKITSSPSSISSASRIPLASTFTTPVSPAPVPPEIISTWYQSPTPSPIPEVLSSSVSSQDVPVAPSTLPLVPIPLPTISETLSSTTPTAMIPPSVTRTYPSSSVTAIGANDEGKSDKKGAAAGAIVGGLLGCIAVIGLILFAIRWYKRRSRSDKEALLRSSWFYGGDVAIPEEEDEQEKITRYWQSGFRAPSMYKKTAYRLSMFANSFTANLKPGHRDSSRFPRMSALIPSLPGKQAEGYDPRLDVPPPMSIVPGQGGWATRFFNNPASEQADVRGPNPRSYRPWSSLHPQPGPTSDMITRTSPTSRPSISHPFAAPASTEETDQQWGRSYSTSPSGSPPTTNPSLPPTRDLLIRNPSSSNSAYSGIAGAIRKVSPVASPYPMFDPRTSSQSNMEVLANTPTSLSTAEAKSTIIANLNRADSTLSYPEPRGNVNHDNTPSLLFDFDPISRGTSQAITDSVYSNNTNQPLVSYYQPTVPGDGEMRNDTMYSTASSGMHPNSRYSAATTATRQSYASGEWTNTEAGSNGGGRETRDWYNQPAWDETLARNADDQGKVGMTARKSVKSVKWNDDDDGMPRAL